MKIIKEYTLPEEQDDYDRDNQAGSMALVLYELANHFRNWRKHGERSEIPVEEIEHAFWDILNEYKIDPYGG